MVSVIAEAVRRRERTIPSGRPMDVEGTTIRLLPHVVRDAREKARRTRLPHNAARLTFVTEVLGKLVRALAAARGVDVDEESRPGLMAELYASIDVRREVNWCWAPIDPQRLLREMYAIPERLAEAGARADPRRAARCCAATAAQPWTIADVALLDEAAELLGEDESPRSAARAAGRGRAPGGDRVRQAGAGDLRRRRLRRPPRISPAATPAAAR